MTGFDTASARQSSRQCAGHWLVIRPPQPGSRHSLATATSAKCCSLYRQHDHRLRNRFGGDRAHPALHGSLRKPLSQPRLYRRASRPIACASATAAESFAARFAAKEAGAKALGTGISYGVSWLEIEVVREPSGRPSLRFHGRAAQIAARLGFARAALSITHTAELAVASVVLEDGN